MNGLTLKFLVPAAMLSLIAAAAFAEPPRGAAAAQPDWAKILEGGAAAPTTAPPSTEPTSPATRPAADVQASYEQLAAAESDVRERARVELMGLGRGDLDTLRQVIQKSGPPAAQQAAVLRDIVMHVYLAGDEYEPSRPGAGFLGVKLGIDRGGGITLPEDTAVSVGESDSGVPIAEAMPGFCGFRYLQAGDVVLGVDAQQWMRTPTSAELIDTVSHTPPGSKITLKVLRQGRVISIELTLSARPQVAADPTTTKVFIDDRQDRAEQYWRSHFVPLLDRGVS